MCIRDRPTPVCFDVNTTITLPIGSIFRSLGLPGDEASVQQLVGSNAFQRLKAEALDKVFPLLGGTGATFQEQANSLSSWILSELQTPFKILPLAYDLFRRGRDALAALGTTVPTVFAGLLRAIESFVDELASAQTGTGRRMSAAQPSLPDQARVIKVGVHVSVSFSGQLAMLMSLVNLSLIHI